MIGSTDILPSVEEDAGGLDITPVVVSGKSNVHGEESGQQLLFLDRDDVWEEQERSENLCEE